MFYIFKDGIKVLMIILYKKGIEFNGKNLIILYGYGGFNVSLILSYSLIVVVWFEYGGVYVVVNICGGGEYGKEWYVNGI